MLRHRLEYGLVRSIAFLAGTLPLRCSLWLGRRIGVLFFSILKIRRQVTCQNLVTAFPLKKNWEIHRIARNTYQNFGMTFLELLMLNRINVGTQTGFEDLDFLSAGKDGLVVVTFHFGNWEILGKALAENGLHLNVVVRKQANPGVDTWVNRLRSDAGMHVIYDQHAKAILEAARRGEAIGLLADQHPTGQGVTVPFFGRETVYPTGPAHLALTCQIPIAVFFPVRHRVDHHRFFVHLLNPAPADTPATLTQKYSDLLETYVKKFPDQWFWPHRRWP